MTVSLQDAINAIQAGDHVGGKALLAQLLQQDPNNEAAWIWMSGTVEEIDQRRYCLEKALAINPANATAQAGLIRMGFQLPTVTPPTPLARMDHGLGQPDSEPVAAPHSTPAFVWPEEEESSDKSPIVEDTFVGDIVAAMNKDEPSSQKPADSDLNWLFPEEQTAKVAVNIARPRSKSCGISILTWSRNQVLSSSLLPGNLRWMPAQNPVHSQPIPQPLPGWKRTKSPP